MRVSFKYIVNYDLFSAYKSVNSETLIIFGALDRETPIFMAKKQFNVTGMSCAACSARVEKAVNTVEGVESCAVSLLTNSMSVEGTAAEDKIIDAVIKAGYSASAKGAEKAEAKADPFEDKETPVLKKRLFSSLGFLVVLMYFSMGHMMFGFPVPEFFEGNLMALGM